MRLAEESPFREKLLLAPSLRAGYQWLDSAARCGRPVLNFRVNTLRRLALQVALPVMAERGLELAGAARRWVIVDELFSSLSAPAPVEGYLAGLAPGQSMIDALVGAVEDLRMAGLTSADLEPSDFEVPGKGREVRQLLGSYEQRLEGSGLVDHAGAIRLAVERVSSEPVFEDAVLAVSPDVLAAAGGLERAFWGAVPDRARRLLDTDEPRRDLAGAHTDLDLLSYVGSPDEAPEGGAGDGTVEIFRAAGEANEVREVLRRCSEQGIPLDDVELIHTDHDTYVPLVYEICRELEPEEGDGPGDAADRPVGGAGGGVAGFVTFREGIPVSYSRPARALAGWLSWISEGFPQSVLVEMFSDGLLQVDAPASDDDAGHPEAAAVSYTRLGAILRAVPIGAGVDRYLPLIDSELAALGARVEEGDLQVGGGDLEEETEERRAERMARLKQRKEALGRLRRATERILRTIPAHGDPSVSMLWGASAFLQESARCRGELDRYSRKKLVEDIDEMIDCLADSRATAFEPLSWLAALLRGTRLMGEGPRPGCLYVSSLEDGGQSGRRHTFVVGLDDARFPAGGRQDPLLLDGERARLSPELRTGAGRLAASLADFSRLVSGLRGRLTLSYPCRDLLDDRELFPSPVVLAAFRLVGDRDGDLEDLARFAGEPASFAPPLPSHSVSETDWWLSRLCAAGRLSGVRESLGERFPNLGRGLVAADARRSDLFTEYDGWVPEAGPECDPTSPDGPVLSASRLETLASCPQEYFLKYVLRVEPVQEYELDPNTWLDRLQLGTLLHSTFKRVMLELRARGLRPVYDRDLPLLSRLLDQEISTWKKLHPPGTRAVFERCVRELRLVSRIFLREEQEHCRGRHPEFFEMSVGGEPEGEGCPLDRPEPVIVALSDEVSIRLRGRIDRIDRLEAPGGHAYEIWDYKTGGTRGYDQDDPLSGGRRLQGAVYLELAAPGLSTVSPRARAERFGYFFPGARGLGERFSWPADELLAAARPVMLRLCSLVSQGCFPFSCDWESDVRFSDYLPAFGDPERAQEAIRRKLANPENEMLRDFALARGIPFAGGDEP